jgi:hypothetical protein
VYLKAAIIRSRDELTHVMREREVEMKLLEVIKGESRKNKITRRNTYNRGWFKMKELKKELRQVQ